MNDSAQNKRQKRMIILLVVMVAIASSLGTLVVGNLIDLSRNDRVMVQRSDYDRLVRYKRLFEVEDILKNDHLYEADDQKLVDYAIKGLVSAMDDRYSAYMTAEEYRMVQQDNEGTMAGIGILMSIDATDQRATVLRVYPNTPAAAAGLQKGDKLLAADGKALVEMDIKQVAAELRGEEGSKVTLSLLRNGQEVSATVTRAMYTATRVEYAMLENSVGYISVSEFTGDVVEAYNNALADLQNQGMKGLIVDLRDNPGGYYDAVCTMVDQLLPEGPIVSTKDRHNRESVKKSDANALGIPLVVLVNGNSASASEIFAGAVQDYGVGSLVGTKTFGKGLVQIDIPFKSDGAALKYTYAKYYTPKGRDINGVGIDPDVNIDLPQELKENPAALTRENDVQLQKALDILRPQVAD